jgi:hypothetical protein
MRTHVILSAIVCMGLSTAFAQQATMSLQFKPRMEYRDGYMTLPSENSEPSFHVNNRVRLQLGYTAKKLEVVVQPQYVYVWGQNAFNSAADNNLSMYQAYAQLNLYGKNIDSTHTVDQFALRLGRQELNYDGGRILSNLDWAPQGIRHDAALFILEHKGWSIQAGAGFNQESATLFGSTYSKNMYKSFQMIRLHKEGERFNGSLLLFKDDFQKFLYDSAGNATADGINSRINAGTYLNVKLSNHLDIESEVYTQQGTDQAGAQLNAWLFNLQLTYKAINGNLTVTPGIDYVSGNNGLATDSINRSFFPTYGINHKFYGYMDYFYVASPFGTAGLQDVFVRTSYKINGKWGTALHMHYFSTANNINDVNDPGKAADPYLGTEVDWILNHQFADNAHIQFGACMMLGSETLKQIKGLPETAASTGMFTYLQFVVTPRFL